MRIAGLTRNCSGPVTLGFRAENASIVAVGVEIGAAAFSTELLGNAAVTTVRVGNALVVVKAGKDYRADIGDSICAPVLAAMCHDQRTGQPARLPRGAERE